MGNKIIQNSLQYFILLCICLVSFLLEKQVGLTLLSVWLFLYMCYRSTSLVFLFFTSLLYDAFFFHSPGVTALFLSFMMLLLTYMNKKHLPKFSIWISSFFGCLLFEWCTKGRVEFPPIGFYFCALLFFLLYLYRIRVRDIFIKPHEHLFTR